MNSQISREQIAEWAENPITIKLKELTEAELNLIMGAPLSNNLMRGQPQLTQEILVENATRELEWAEFAAMLGGDWSGFEEFADEFAEEEEEEDE